MARLMVELTASEVHADIPYAVICMTRYGAHWGTMRCKRRWKEEFTEAEREKARKLFSRSHDWLLGRGVPEKVQMSVETYQLWQKLGCFCGSI